jgi:hypothetical protein
MKIFSLLILALFLTAASSAADRDWKIAKIEATSETDVSSKLGGEKNTTHYTIETQDMIYFADYSFNPAHKSGSHPPGISVNALTKIAIHGKTAYVLDITGKEYKLHITRKTKRQY